MTDIVPGQLLYLKTGLRVIGNPSGGKNYTMVLQAYHPHYAQWQSLEHKTIQLANAVESDPLTREELAYQWLIDEGIEVCCQRGDLDDDFTPTEPPQGWSPWDIVKDFFRHKR